MKPLRAHHPKVIDEITATTNIRLEKVIIEQTNTLAQAITKLIIKKMSDQNHQVHHHPKATVQPILDTTADHIAINIRRKNIRKSLAILSIMIPTMKRGILKRKPKKVNVKDPDQGVDAKQK